MVPHAPRQSESGVRIWGIALDGQALKLRYHETLDRIRADILSGEFSSGMRLKIAEK